MTAQQEQYEFRISSRVPDWKEYGETDLVVLTINIHRQDYRILTKYTLKQIYDMSEEDFKHLKHNTYARLYAVVISGQSKKSRSPFRKVSPKPPEIQG